MLSISQILLALLLASIPSIIADASANDTEIPEQLAQYSVEIGTLFPSSGFTPLFLNPVIQHNRISKREQVPCYEFPGSCNGALCCDNGSCAGTDQVCCGDGVCNGVTCCDNGYCAGAGQTCCAAGVCGVGAGCCEGKTCVGYTEACCDDGSHCPAGYGCFSYGDSNQIICSPTGGGTAPATSTIPVEPASSSTESATSPPSEQTSVAAASSSVYYYTYEYEWTTYYYVYEIESFTTYIVTTVLSVIATDSAAASSSFNDITATAAFTAPPTLLPGGSTPSQSPTQATSTFSAGQSSVAGSGTSNPNAAPSAKIRRGEALGVACIVGAVIIMMMMVLTM